MLIVTAETCPLGTDSVVSRVAPEPIPLDVVAKLVSPAFVNPLPGVVTLSVKIAPRSSAELYCVMSLTEYIWPLVNPCTGISFVIVFIVVNITKVFHFSFFITSINVSFSSVE